MPVRPSSASAAPVGGLWAVRRGSNARQPYLLPYLTELRDALSDVFPIPAVLSDADKEARRKGKPLPSALAAAAGEARGEPPARSRTGAGPAPAKPPPLAPALAAQAAGSGRLSPHAAFEQWARRKKDRQPSKGYGKSYSKGYKGRRGG